MFGYIGGFITFLKLFFSTLTKYIIFPDVMKQFEKSIYKNISSEKDNIPNINSILDKYTPDDKTAISVNNYTIDKKSLDRLQSIDHILLFRKAEVL